MTKNNIKLIKKSKVKYVLIIF